MATRDFPYTKLPGTRRGIVSGASLWLGADHILYVKNTRFSEEYRRYYLNDIEAIYLRKMPRFQPPPGTIIALFALLLAQVVSAIAGWHIALQVGWFCLLALIAFAAWLCVFRSCACFIQTALGTDTLSCLHRVTGARRAIDQITERVIQAQGPMRVVEEVADTPPPLPRSAAEIVPERPQRRHLFGWLSLVFVLVSATVVLRLPVPPGQWLIVGALGSILAQVVCAVLALVRESRRDRSLSGALIALLAVSGLELYALVMVNTYSQTATSMQGGAAVIQMMVQGSHVASRWLAGSDIVVACVVAILLIRSAQRSDA